MELKDNYSLDCDYKSHWEGEKCWFCIHNKPDKEELYFCTDDGTCPGHVQNLCQRTLDPITMIGDCPLQNEY